MCVTATAKRRRRQAKQGYNHLAKKQRPIYRARSAEKATERLRRTLEAERARKQRGAKK